MHHKLLFAHAIRRGGYQPPAQYKLKIARNVGRIRTSFPHLYHSTKHSIYQPGGRLVAAPTNGVYVKQQFVGMLNETDMHKKIYRLSFYMPHSLYYVKALLK